MPELVSAYKFDNGMVMAFDVGGNQMPQYQGHIDEVGPKIRADYPVIDIISARWSADGMSIEPLARPFQLRRQRESVTAAEVIEQCRSDPVTVNRIEMAISKICGET